MDSDPLLERWRQATEHIPNDDLPELRHLLWVVPIVREVDIGEGVLQFISLESYTDGCVLRFVLWLNQALPVAPEPPSPEAVLLVTDDLGNRYAGWFGAGWAEGQRDYDFWYRIPRPLDTAARSLVIEVREIWWIGFAEPDDSGGEVIPVMEGMITGPWKLDVDLS